MHHNSLAQKIILEREQELFEAIKLRDIEKLDELLHDDLLFILPNGETLTKQMDLDSHRRKEMVVDKLELDYEQINIINDTAVVTLKMNTEGKMLGNNFKGTFRYLRIWKLVDEQLKVIGGCCSALK